MTSNTLEIEHSSDMTFQRLCSYLRSQIALAFIQKNEGSFAVEMLQSVIPIVGFVAFVDTGSEDGSEAEIEEYLASAGVPFASKSIRSERFDAMRNASLELVPDGFEWVLVMDADEILLSKDFGAIRTLVERDDVDVWSLPRFNWIDKIWGELQPAYPDYQARLFRADPRGKIKYDGRVHEVPIGFDNHVRSSHETLEPPHSDNLHIHHVKLFRKAPERMHAADDLYSRLAAETAGIQTFSDVLVADSLAHETEMHGSQPIRAIHALSLGQFGAPHARAFWSEWNHVHEGSRSLKSICDGQTVANWQRFIRPGTCCIDIGAHSGDTAIPMAIMSADLPRNIRGKVFAVEPNPHVFEVLRINATLNSNIGHFKAFRCVISKADQPEVLISDHANANCNGGITDAGIEELLHDRLIGAERTSFKVPGLSLQTFIQTYLSVYEQRNLSFIKIDCEGYDKEILWSARQILLQSKPVIMVEWFDFFEEKQSADLFRAIQHIQYVAYDAHTLTQANVARKASDLILIPRDRVAEFF